MDQKFLIEIVAIAVIAGAPLVLLIERLLGDRGIGARTIQFLAVSMLIPTILILALEKIIESSTVGTLVGALTGYLLSGVGDYRPDRKRKGEDETPAVRQ